MRRPLSQTCARPRTSDADVTLFVSLGLAIEDVAAGAAVLAVTD